MTNTRIIRIGLEVGFGSDCGRKWFRVAPFVHDSNRRPTLRLLIASLAVVTAFALAMWGLSATDVPRDTVNTATVWR